MNSEIRTLKNLSEVSEKWLNQAGIFTRADLQRLGPVAAWERVRALGYPASLNLVYAIQGALLDMHWNHLPRPLVKQLKEQVNAAKTRSGD